MDKSDPETTYAQLNPNTGYRQRITSTHSSIFHFPFPCRSSCSLKVHACALVCGCVRVCVRVSDNATATHANVISAITVDSGNKSGTE